MFAHVEALYGHMIQSRHPPDAGAPKLNCREPVVAILMIIQVLFVSPVSKQPEFALAGLMLGLTTEPGGSSWTLPKPFGVTEKLALVHTLIASMQSSAVTDGGGGGGQGTQEIVAFQPAILMLGSDVKTNVRQFPWAISVPGLVHEKGLPG